MTATERSMTDVARITKEAVSHNTTTASVCPDLLRSRTDNQVFPSATWSSIWRNIVTFLHAHDCDLLRYSLAIVFIWFGALKPLGMSPANDLVERTVWWFSADWFIPVLGLVEVAIGFGLLFRRLIPLALVMLFLQMAGTLLPLFTLIDICYTHFPYGLTIEGQYIVKNAVLITAAIVIGLRTTTDSVRDNLN